MVWLYISVCLPTVRNLLPFTIFSTEWHRRWRRKTTAVLGFAFCRPKIGSMVILFLQLEQFLPGRKTEGVSTNPCILEYPYCLIAGEEGSTTLANLSLCVTPRKLILLRTVIWKVYLHDNAIDLASQCNLAGLICYETITYFSEVVSLAWEETINNSNFLRKEKCGSLASWKAVL